VDYSDAVKQLIWNYRLDFDPVGIRFVFDDSEKDNLLTTHKARSRLTLCQHVAAVRQAGYSLLMEPGACLCKNAQLILGWRQLDREADTRYHLKYACNPEHALEIAQNKPGLEYETCKGVYMAPLDVFDNIELEPPVPHVIYIMCVPFQALHILNDYMAATGRPSLSFFQTPNSAMCGGSVWCFQQNSANMNTMCPGSKASGKTEMNYVNVFIPGTHFIDMVNVLKKRCEKSGGPSLLGKGGTWPGLERCAGCSTLVFKQLSLATRNLHL